MSCRLVLIVLVAAVSTARAQGLAELLGGVAANARFDVPARELLPTMRVEERLIQPKIYTWLSHNLILGSCGSAKRTK